MSKATVYSFLVGNIIEDRLEQAKGKATREKIESLGCFVIEETAEVIDDSLLNSTGRYHAKPEGPRDPPNR